MKRLSLVVAAVFAFTAFACSKKEESGDETKDKKSDVKDDKGDKGDTEDGKPMARKPDNKPETPEPPKGLTPEGVITEMEGAVQVRRAGAAEFTAAKKETEIFAGDTVRMANDGSATLTLWDHSSVELSPASAVVLDSSRTVANPSAIVTVMAGAVQLDVAKRTQEQGPFMVYAPAAVAAVQGTVLDVAVALNGATRIGVEEGEVEVTATAKPDAKPTKVAKGKSIEVAVGTPKGKVGAFKPKSADWDAWLEATDAEAAKAAQKVASLHQNTISTLGSEVEVLEKKEEEIGKEAEGLAEKVKKVGEEKKKDRYTQLRPKLVDRMETLDTARYGRDLLQSRMAAHAYLLGVMHARMKAGVYKVPKVQIEKVGASVEAADKVMPVGWRLRLRRRRRGRRRRLRRLRRAYYRHHPRGRKLAPKVGVKIPEFYAKVKLKPRRRARRRRIAGVKMGLYRPPRYRGKRLKRVRIRRALRKKTNRHWWRKAKWKTRQKKHRARRRKHRQRWRKRVVARRRKRWRKRPKVRIRRMRRRRRRMGKGMGKGMRGRRRKGMGMGMRSRRRKGMGMGMGQGMRSRRRKGMGMGMGMRNRRRKGMGQGMRSRRRKGMGQGMRGRRRKVGMGVRKLRGKKRKLRLRRKKRKKRRGMRGRPQ